MTFMYSIGCYSLQYDEEFGEESVEEEDYGDENEGMGGLGVPEQVAVAGTAGAGKTMTLGKTMTKAASYQEAVDKKNEAANRKAVLTQFCKNNNYLKFEDLKKLLDVYYEQTVPESLNYQQFIKFVRVDDNNDNREVYYTLIGRKNIGKKTKVESKVLILYLLNCIAGYPREEKLQFAFNLFDEEDSRSITHAELKKILMANSFANTIAEVEKKSKLITEEAKTSGDDHINYDDFMALAKRYGALFFPMKF